MHDYTKVLQNNLTNNIREILKNEGLDEIFVVKKEQKISVFGNIDIAIFKKDDEFENPKKILGIEIEVVNQYKQIVKNFDNFKNYIHKSKNRKGGLLQIFSNFANIDTD